MKMKQNFTQLKPYSLSLSPTVPRPTLLLPTFFLHSFSLPHHANFWRPNIFENALRILHIFLIQSVVGHSLQISIVFLF